MLIPAPLEDDVVPGGHLLPVLLRVVADHLPRPRVQDPLGVRVVVQDVLQIFLLQHELTERKLMFTPFSTDGAK